MLRISRKKRIITPLPKLIIETPNKPAAPLLILY
jgi:hypothetical protein